MDIKRPPKSKLKKKIRTVILAVVGVAAIGGITYALAKIKPAAPTLDRSTVVIETVQRGPFVRRTLRRLSSWLTTRRLDSGPRAVGAEQVDVGSGSR